MIHALIYHGFKTDTMIGQLERKYYNDLIDQIDLKWRNDNNLLINGAFLNEKFQCDLEALLSSYRPDRVFIGSMSERWDMTDWAKDKFPTSQIYYVGNMDSPYHFCFFACFCEKFFPTYTESQLTVNQGPKVFLCYQNKAHHNRQMLAYKIINENLGDLGHLTLVQAPMRGYDFPGLDVMVGAGSPRPREFHYEHADIGPLDIWNGHLLNIVSETLVDPAAEIFLTEKIFKPMIGLRPFVLNSDPRIYSYLEKNGFDVFPDLIPVQKLKQSKDFDTVTDIIIDVIKHLSTQNLSKLYVDMLPRLIYNKNRFHEFANEHQQRISNFFK